MKRIEPIQIGDALDLDDEKTYPCSDYSKVTTVNVDGVADAQLASCEKEFEAWKQEEADWLEKQYKNADAAGILTPDGAKNWQAHIASLREVM